MSGFKQLMDPRFCLPPDEFIVECLESRSHSPTSRQIIHAGISIPSDEFLAEWLEAESHVIHRTIEPICYISRQERKIRRIKDRLEHYMFITEENVSFTLDRFRRLLSTYLKLNYDFQLIKVDNNRFILTLEADSSPDHAYAMLEEGKMICLAQSNILCYPTDEYAEGYYGGNLAYELNDDVADMYTEVQIHALPLHLRTIKAIERILLRYCVVEGVDDDCLSSKRLDCISCHCWAEKGATFPRFVIIRVASKFSEDSLLLPSVLQKHVQTYCVAITSRVHGHPHPTTKFQQHDSKAFVRALQTDRVSYCFLRDADVCGARIKELQESILLRPKKSGPELTVQEIAFELQSAMPSTNNNLTVQSIGVQGYIARSTGLPLCHLLQKASGHNNDIQICSEAFSWLTWSTGFGAVKESLQKKINVQTMCLQKGFNSPTIVEDLLSPFCMFDTNGYDPGTSADIRDYRSVVWTDINRNIPTVILVRAAPPFCETVDRSEGKVVELTVMTAYNKGPGIEELHY